MLFFTLERELLWRNVMQRSRPFEVDDKSARQAIRDAFTEAEVQAILPAAEPRKRALIALLCFTGMRPGEAYALLVGGGPGGCSRS